MKKRRGATNFIEDTDRVLSQVLENAKQTFDSDFTFYLQELSLLKEKYIGIAKQEQFGTASLSSAFQPTPLKKPVYESPIVKSEPRTRRDRKNITNSPCSPYRPRTPQKDQGIRIIDGNYALPPARLPAAKPPARLPAAKPRPTESKKARQPQPDLRPQSLPPAQPPPAPPAPHKQSPLPQDGFHSLLEQVTREAQLQQQKQQSPAVITTPRKSAGRRGSDQLEALFDDVLAEAEAFKQQKSDSTPKREKLSQILAFKREKVEKHRKEVEAAKREKAKYSTPVASPASVVYKADTPVFAPSPLKRAATAQEFAQTPKKALSPEQKERLKQARARLSNQIGSPKNFQRMSTELIFTEDDQPVLIELKNSPIKKKKSSPKRKRGDENGQSPHVTGGELETTTRKSALVNCQFAILQRATPLPSEDGGKKKGSPKKPRIDEPASKDSEVEKKESIPSQGSGGSWQERIASRLHEQEKKEEEEKGRERKEREEKRRHFREQLQMKKEKEGVLVKNREQTLFEQKEEDPLELAIERAVQREEREAAAKKEQENEKAKEKEKEKEEHKKQQHGVAAPPPPVVVVTEAAKDKGARLQPLTKDRPKHEGKRLPSQEKRNQMKAISAMPHTVIEEEKPCTPSRKRKSADAEISSEIIGTATKISVIEEEDKTQSLRDKLKRRSVRKSVSPSPVVTKTVQNPVRNLTAASPQRGPLSPVRKSLQNKAGAVSELRSQWQQRETNDRMVKEQAAQAEKERKEKVLKERQAMKEKREKEKNKVERVQKRRQDQRQLLQEKRNPANRHSVTICMDSDEDSNSEEIICAVGDASKRRKVSLDRASLIIDSLEAMKEDLPPSTTSSYPKSPRTSLAPGAAAPSKQHASPSVWRGEDFAALRQRQNEERKENAQKLYGLDAELAQKAQEKMDPVLVSKVLRWVKDVVDRAQHDTTRRQSIAGDITKTLDSNFTSFDSLKSGIVLCCLLNAIRPGTILRINRRPIPLMERENIQTYLDGCVKLGVRKSDLFVISDLYEEKYLNAVLVNLIAVSRVSTYARDFKGPLLNLH